MLTKSEAEERASKALAGVIQRDAFKSRLKELYRRKPTDRSMYTLRVELNGPILQSHQDWIEPRNNEQAIVIFAWSGQAHAADGCIGHFMRFRDTKKDDALAGYTTCQLLRGMLETMKASDIKRCFH